MMLQSAVLGVGGYLVIHQQATAGIIIAGSILSARALAPVDLAIANWKGFVAARQSWHRLTRLLAALPAQMAPMSLQAPRHSIAVEGVAVAAARRAAGRRAGRRLQARGRQGLGIIGPSGSGKSSLARMLVGVWHAGARQGAARRRRARPVVLGSARRAYRLSAAGRRADGRHGGAEHRPFRARARLRRGHRRRQGRRRARHDRQPARGLRDARSASRAPRCPPARPSASRSRARSTAIPSWWCSTSPIPTSIPRATRR